MINPSLPSYQREATERKRRKLISRSSLIVVAILAVCAAIIAVLFFAKLFDVREIKVTSPTLIPRGEVEKLAWEVLNDRRLGIARKSNIVLFSPQKIRPALMKAFPRIDSVEIRRDSLHRITIIVRERIPAGLWCLSAHERCFYYDAEGIAFSEIASSSGFLFVPVNDARDRNIDIGQRVAPDYWREDILQVKKVLQFGGISASQFIIPNDSFNEFHVVVAEGWSILYSTDHDVKRQTDNLLVFLREKISADERKNLDYIDLRIEDRIYYKMR
ncbi:MAG: FtsQ-type POTRA domain-containing protein [Patescibacteria group bacterium]